MMPFGKYNTALFCGFTVFFAIERINRSQYSAASSTIIKILCWPEAFHNMCRMATVCSTALKRNSSILAPVLSWPVNSVSLRFVVLGSKSGCRSQFAGLEGISASSERLRRARFKCQAVLLSARIGDRGRGSTPERNILQWGQSAIYKRVCAITRFSRECECTRNSDCTFTR